ncbi:hypothetical protein CZ797_04220 [Pseudoalteromonas sp. JB197]|nr:hypothetical protein CZ797_04220 [Pseudoalteromonas sp. JB197]
MCTNPKTIYLTSVFLGKATVMALTKNTKTSTRLVNLLGFGP